MRKEPTSFTLVFKGNIRKIECNPLTAETVFGTAYAVGIGDAFQDADRLRAALLKITEMHGVPFGAVEYARHEATRAPQS